MLRDFDLSPYNINQGHRNKSMISQVETTNVFDFTQASSSGCMRKAKDSVVTFLARGICLAVDDEELMVKSAKLVNLS